jgi:hypothetical protein
LSSGAFGCLQRVSSSDDAGVDMLIFLFFHCIKKYVRANDEKGLSRRLGDCTEVTFTSKIEKVNATETIENIIVFQNCVSLTFKY